MNLNNIIALVKFDFKGNLANPMSMFTIIVMYPLIMFSSVANQDQTALLIMLCLFVTMQAMISTIMHVPIKETTNRDQKVIKRLITSPVSKLDYLMSGIVSQYLITLIPVFLMILICKSSLSLHIVISLIIVFTLLFITCYLLGFVISQIVSDAQSAKAVGMLFFILMIYAINSSTGSLQIFTKLIPIEQISGVYRSIIFQQNIDITNVLFIVGIYILVYGRISLRKFKWE